MTNVPSARARGPFAGLLARAFAAMAAIPDWPIALVARLSIAGVFWQSGRTKVEGFAVTDTAIALFQDEYKLPLISPWLGAHLAAFAEQGT